MFLTLCENKLTTAAPTRHVPWKWFKKTMKNGSVASASGRHISHTHRVVEALVSAADSALYIEKTEIFKAPKPREIERKHGYIIHLCCPYTQGSWEHQARCCIEQNQLEKMQCRIQFNILCLIYCCRSSCYSKCLQFVGCRRLSGRSFCIDVKHFPAVFDGHGGGGGEERCLLEKLFWLAFVI